MFSRGVMLCRAGLRGASVSLRKVAPTFGPKARLLATVSIEQVSNKVTLMYIYFYSINQIVN